MIVEEEPNSSPDLKQALLWEGQGERAKAQLADDEALVVDVEGFEGPLDLLLQLARNQKVDILKISILALAEQYLEFIQEARQMKLEIAADYLVMAAWLAYLKSRLLLPDISGDEDEPTGAELAAALAFRLQRLEAMRKAVSQLMARPQLGEDVFARGTPELTVIIKESHWQATLYDLLTAYAAQKQRNSITSIRVEKRSVWSLQDAKDVLMRMVGQIAEWTPVDSFLIDYFTSDDEKITVRASSFSASLELVKDGSVELKQSEHFQPIFIRDAKSSLKGSDE